MRLENQGAAAPTVPLYGYSRRCTRIPYAFLRVILYDYDSLVFVRAPSVYTRVERPLRMARLLCGTAVALNCLFTVVKRRHPAPCSAHLIRSICKSRPVSELIDAHNTANDGSTFTLGHNEFSHLSWDEFKETVSYRIVVVGGG